MRVLSGSEEYLAPVPENERGDMVKAYHKLLNSEDDAIRYVITAEGAMASYSDPCDGSESMLLRLGPSGSK